MSEKRYLNLNELRTGDVIFSTTPDPVSKLIQKGSNSPFSHASIYVGDGVIVESNDGGVSPRVIPAEAVSAEGHLLGLPYSDWQSIVVLRHDKYRPEAWDREITRTLEEHLGLDYPPLSAVVRSGSGFLATLIYPLALIYDTLRWLSNKEPMAYQAWCSRLVGYVLSSRFSYRLTATQKFTLAFADPQKLHDVARDLGYSKVEKCVAPEVADQENVFDELREDYLSRRDPAFKRWRELKDQRRSEIRGERMFESVRLAAKLLLFLLIGVALLVGIAYWPRPAPPAPPSIAEGLTPPPVPEPRMVTSFTGPGQLILSGQFSDGHVSQQAIEQPSTLGQTESHIAVPNGATSFEVRVGYKWQKQCEEGRLEHLGRRGMDVWVRPDSGDVVKGHIAYHTNSIVLSMKLAPNAKTLALVNRPNPDRWCATLLWGDPTFRFGTP